MLKIKIKSTMQQICSQRQQLRDYWAQHGRQVCTWSKITQVYQHFCEYCREHPTDPPFAPLNQYIFRSMIRKMGYKNPQNKTI